MFISGSLESAYGGFLLVLIELFRWVLRLSRYERKEIENRPFHYNAVCLIQHFRYKGSPQPIIFAQLVRTMNALQLCR